MIKSRGEDKTNKSVRNVTFKYVKILLFIDIKTLYENFHILLLYKFKGLLSLSITYFFITVNVSLIYSSKRIAFL